MELVFFLGLALVAAVAAVLVVVQRHAVYSALYLIITMGALAGIYILLEAHFVWVIQVIVYAGAIMVLFLFVIMLLDIRREPDPWAAPDRGRILVAVLLSVVLLVELGMAVGTRLVDGVPTPPGDFGMTETVGRLLFTDFLYPFEITSIILLVAMVGAMVLAKKHLT
ncbi:MAG: NADH-quinone oxidoreductase subunit J [Candidatus Methylomirabilota bacterium]